jgi:hypothetical protein
VNEGLLVESEARTNLLPNSNFDEDTSWTGVGIVGAAASGVTSPDGATSNIELLTSNGTGNARYFDLLTLTAVNYTFSGFFKAATHDIIALTLSVVADFTDRYVWFDLTAGTKGTVGADILGSGIEDYGNGWYRCWIMNAATAEPYYARVHILDSDGVTTSTDGDSVYAYGAQLEAGSTPSSYIPTSGATVTRPADTLTVPSANLPWPSPVVIGEELVTNGTFDTDLTGWTINGAGASAAVVGGVAVVTRGSNVSGITQQYVTEVGKVYKATATIGLGTASFVSFRSGISVWTSTDYINVFGAGTYEFYFVATSTSAWITVYGGTVLGETFTADNISVREINPLAVSIQMDGRMTYADTSSLPEVELVRWLLDGSNNIRTYLTTSSTLTGRLDFVQENANVTDSVSTSDSYFSPGVNVSYNIASRHGSTFINGAVDGTALTANTTPTALPDLSATDLQLAFDYMGTIRTFRVWADDLGDENIEIASATAPVIIGLPTIGVS